MRVIGLMSGTSLDGIDAALVNIEEERDQIKIDLLALESVAYTEELRSKLKYLLPPNEGGIEELAYLHFYLGQKLAEAALRVMRKAHLASSEVDLIGSHGQTICNLPQGKDEFSPHSRLQIGDISVIAAQTGITTVGDFRPADVAAGGEGAPLIPYFDYHAFKSVSKTRAIINIGGIANVTYLPAGAKLDDVQGFDTGPGNMVIDAVVRLLHDNGEGFDRDGRLASKGTPCDPLLKGLMSHPFIQKNPPKSAGREEFGEEFLNRVIEGSRNYNLSNSDVIATITAFTAEAIAYNCKHFLGPVDEVIVGGGGAFNKTLLDMIRERFLHAEVTTTDEHGIPAKAREAMGFALLAYQAFHGKPNNVPSVTGAKRSVVMGKIAWGNR